MQAWNRLALKVKEVLGFDFCEVGRNSLKFNRQEGTNGWTLKAQDLVYNMLAECFLTPENVARIVLLPNLDKIMETKQQISFIEALDDIKGHSLVLANTNVTFNDIKKGSAISVIS
jgi:hypothetical protein